MAGYFLFAIQARNSIGPIVHCQMSHNPFKNNRHDNRVKKVDESSTVYNTAAIRLQPLILPDYRVDYAEIYR